MTASLNSRLFKTEFSLKEPLLLSYTIKEEGVVGELSPGASPPMRVRHFLQLHVTEPSGPGSLVFLDPRAVASQHGRWG